MAEEEKHATTPDMLGLPWSGTDYASIYSARLDDNVAYVGLEHEHGDAIRTPRDRAIRDHIIVACNSHASLVRQRDKLLQACREAAMYHQGHKSVLGRFLHRVIAEIEKEEKP